MRRTPPDARSGVCSCSFSSLTGTSLVGATRGAERSWQFYGWDIQARVLCVADTRVTRADGHSRGNDRKVRPVSHRSRRLGRQSQAGQHRRLAVDIGARFLWADDNTRFANGQRVSLTTLEPAVSINLLSKYPDRETSWTTHSAPVSTGSVRLSFPRSMAPFWNPCASNSIPQPI